MASDEIISKQTGTVCSLAEKVTSTSTLSDNHCYQTSTNRQILPIQYLYHLPQPLQLSKEQRFHLLNALQEALNKRFLFFATALSAPASGSMNRREYPLQTLRHGGDQKIRR